MKGEKLSDMHTQSYILKNQFPNLNDLRCVLYQQRKLTTEKEEMLKDQLQIIHCHSDHWIAASNVGCENGGVKACLALFTFS